MNAFLMYKNRDFNSDGRLPPNEHELTQDLELKTLFNAMALGDKFLFNVAREAVLSGVNDLDVILYRQNILKDCLKNKSIVREMYDVVVEGIENKKKHYFGIFTKYPSSILNTSIELMQQLVNTLKRLKNIADEHAEKFHSEGFAAFFAMLTEELSDEYFFTVHNHLRELKCKDGVLISVELGEGNKGVNYILRKQRDKKLSWMARLFAKKPPVYTIQINERDESGARALMELKDRGINRVANALAQSTDHILGFFNMLRTELAFYIGCLNLYEQLSPKGVPICFPLPIAHSENKCSFKGLYDVCLALILEHGIVGNDVDADGKDLVMITGANQGGKSTFLRSIGLAHLMMQCGLFVPADTFCANIREIIFTHYKREEDSAMKSGKLDEELGRMSHIVDKITSNSMVLFNESFAATNEREGSEIARQIVCALVEERIKVFFVTHLYELAHGFYDKKKENSLFLRAERQTDGGRTFKVIEGEPLQTSYGGDLYKTIFGKDE